MPKRKKLTSVYFSSLQVENVRCFGDSQRLNLTAADGRPARWTLILGDNGVGKTTLLQCLAWLRLLPEGDSEGSKTTADHDAANFPFLVKGKLNSALNFEENQILEDLLRVDSAPRLVLSGEFSSRGTLSSTSENPEKRAVPPKTIEIRAQLDFNAKRHLLKFSGRSPRIEKHFEGEFHEPLVVAYGANRQRGAKNLSNDDLDDPIASRLSGLTELYDVEQILNDLHFSSKENGSESPESKHLERLKRALSRILPGEHKPGDIRIYPPDVLDLGKPNGVCLNSFSGLVPMSALSLGYQTTLAWAADLAWRLIKHFPGSTSPLAEPAVVFIDEIDLHLHPLWQLRIIDDLSATFPGTQFVATAHSPLIVQVAESANLVLLRKRHRDVEIVNDPEVVRSWRVDQFLASELFDVPRARDKQTESLFQRRDALVDNPSRSAAEDRELKKLRNKISALPTAHDPADQKAMDLIREAAALLKKQKKANG